MTIAEAMTTIRSPAAAPADLLKAAAELARSDVAEAHGSLRQALSSVAFLNRLNTPEEHEGNPNSLRVRRVLDTLVANPNPLASQTLLTLTRSQAFLGDSARVVVLIRASSEVRPVPRELVAFWDRYSQPGDEYTHMTIEALIYNGTPEALALFEAKVRTPTHEFDDKLYWFRDNVMPKRNELAIVQSADRLVRDQRVEQGLRLELIDVLYDYKAAWFTAAVNFNPPPLESYPQSVKDALASLASYALGALPLNDARRRVVEKALNDFGRQGAVR